MLLRRVTILRMMTMSMMTRRLHVILARRWYRRRHCSRVAGWWAISLVSVTWWRLLHPAQPGVCGGSSTGTCQLLEECITLLFPLLFSVISLSFSAVTSTPLTSTTLLAPVNH